MERNNKVKRKDGTVKEYDYVSVFCNGYAAVKENEKWGFVNTDGDEICPLKYEFPFGNDEPGYFIDGYAMVGVPTKDGKFLRFGYINTEGKEACPFIYTAACDFRNSIAWVRNEEGKWLLIDKDFKILTKRTYDKVRVFIYGCAVVELDGKYGFVNESGDEKCEIKYEYMSNFNAYGRAQIPGPNEERRIYWIDKEGKEFYSEL